MIICLGRNYRGRLFDNLFEELLIHVADQVESLNVQMSIEG